MYWTVYILDVEDFGNSRDVEGLADPEDAVLDAEVDQTVPATPHDGVVHYGRLTEIKSKSDFQLHFYTVWSKFDS